MPRGDGTGPAGMGPMTGRAAGYCAGSPVPGFMNPYGGRGMGMAWRRGRGRGGPGWGSAPLHGAYGMPYPPYAAPYAAQGPLSAPSPEQDMEMLRGQADWLKQQMDAITERLQGLEKAKG